MSYKDYFAWDYYKMLGLDRGLVEHCVQLHSLPTTNQDVWYVINLVKMETERLFQEKFIRIAWYITWLFNIILIIKKNDKVYFYINFKNLNNATPKDECPMPLTDMLVYLAIENALFSFMDGHSRYNHIFIGKDDLNKITFRCLRLFRIYQLIVKPFSLRNIRATY